MIEADSLPKSYDPFLVKDNGHQNAACLKIKQIETKHKINNYLKLAALSQMNIWKANSNEYNKLWVYEARNKMCMFSVDRKYLNVEYWRSDAVDFFERGESSDLLSPFYQLLIECKLVQGGFTVLHSACVEVEGVAYAFTGPSGVGKSSRANKWHELLSAELISGDRPVIDTRTGRAYGVPWDGKEAIYRNYSCPLAAVFKVVRSKMTYIKVLSEEEKLQLLCEQTFFPLWDGELAARAMHSLKQFLRIIPIYELHCDITNESTYEAYNQITKIIKKRSI